jgi:hypothetical protein
MKDSAEAVNAMVSVPWSTTKPSYRSWKRPRSSAKRAQCESSRFAESSSGSYSSTA